MHAVQPGANAQANLARLLKQIAAASSRTDGDEAEAAAAAAAGPKEVLQQLLRMHAVAGLQQQRPSAASFNAKRAAWYGALTRLLKGYKSHTNDLHSGVLLQLVCLSIHTVRLSHNHDDADGAPPGMLATHPTQLLLFDLLLALTQATHSLQNRATLPDVFGQ